VALAICYISCLMMREPILLVDLIRWSVSGDIPFLSVQFKLPKDIAFRKYLKALVWSMNLRTRITSSLLFADHFFHRQCQLPSR